MTPKITLTGLLYIIEDTRTSKLSEVWELSKGAEIKKPKDARKHPHYYKGVGELALQNLQWLEGVHTLVLPTGATLEVKIQVTRAHQPEEHRTL